MSTHDAQASVAVIIISHQSANDVIHLLQALTPQLERSDELVIVDNASTDRTPHVVRSFHPQVNVIALKSNVGFAGGCNVGAQATKAPLLVFLNPDSEPRPRFLARVREAAITHPDWGAWQAAVLEPDGCISSSGGVVHYLGIAWANGNGLPATLLPSDDCETTFPSGAAMIVRRDAWDALGGIDAEYFMYGEDVDLGLRLWLAGYKVGLVPTAHVIHKHEFDKGHYKWYWLERNRWHTLLAVYPTVLLLMLLPSLLAAELGLLAVALRQGWLKAKLNAQLSVVRRLPRIVKRRRAIQATRQIDTRAFATRLAGNFDNRHLAPVPSLLRSLQLAHWNMILKLLRLHR